MPPPSSPLPPSPHSSLLHVPPPPPNHLPPGQPTNVALMSCSCADLWQARSWPLTWWDPGGPSSLCPGVGLMTLLSPGKHHGGCLAYNSLPVKHWKPLSSGLGGRLVNNTRLWPFAQPISECHKHIYDLDCVLSDWVIIHIYERQNGYTCTLIQT